MSEDRANATKKDGYSLVTSREAMVEVLEQGDVLTVLSQRLQGLGHFVFCPGLIDVREESLLVNPVVVGQADESFYGLALGRSRQGW